MASQSAGTGHHGERSWCSHLSSSGLAPWCSAVLTMVVGYWVNFRPLKPSRPLIWLNVRQRERKTREQGNKDCRALRSRTTKTPPRVQDTHQLSDVAAAILPCAPASTPGNCILGQDPPSPFLCSRGLRGLLTVLHEALDGDHGGSGKHVHPKAPLLCAVSVTSACLACLFALTVGASHMRQYLVVQCLFAVSTRYLRLVHASHVRAS